MEINDFDIGLNLSHIKNAPPEVEDKIVNHFVKKYSEKYPHITKQDFEHFVIGAVDNMFSRRGILRWMKETIPYLTPEVLSEVKEDPYFLLRESHSHLHGPTLAQRASGNYDSFLGTPFTDELFRD